MVQQAHLNFLENVFFYTARGGAVDPTSWRNILAFLDAEVLIRE